MVVAPAPLHLMGDLIAGRYRLERALGAGGMGDVYVAVQEPLGRKVALKVMKAGLTGPAAARFEREAKSLASTSHPNIVTLFDYGRTDDGALFMAMELVPGDTLRTTLVNDGRLGPPEALRIVADICRALDVTHRAGIVHRDLKPENVMLVPAAGRAPPTVKVLDFGIARVQDTEDEGARLTKTGHLVGTPGYMAPETVLEGVFDDPRSDLYAVGVILWELLTCHNLFSAPTPIALVMKHALDPPPTLSTVFSGSSTQPHAELETLLARLLHKDRHQRFATAADVIDAIDALSAAALAPFGDGDASGEHLAAAPTLVKAGALGGSGVVGGPTPIARAGSGDLPPDAATMGSTSAALKTPVTPGGSSGERFSSMPVTQSASTTVRPPPTTKAKTPLMAAGVAVAVLLVVGAVIATRTTGDETTPATTTPPTTTPTTTTTTTTTTSDPTPSPAVLSDAGVAGAGADPNRAAVDDGDDDGDDVFDAGPRRRRTVRDRVRRRIEQRKPPTPSTNPTPTIPHVPDLTP